MPTISGITSMMQRYENKYRFLSVAILFIVKYTNTNLSTKNNDIGIKRYFSALFIISGTETVLNVNTIKTNKKKILEA